MAVADVAVQLAENHTASTDTNWFEIEGPALGPYRVQVQSNNVFDGKTVELQLKDTDGTGGVAIDLSDTVTALGASSRKQYIVDLSSGDQVRLSPSGGGGSMALHIALVPLCNATVTEQV